MEAPPSAPAEFATCPTDGPIGWIVTIFGGLSTLAVILLYLFGAYLFEALLWSMRQQVGSPMSFSQPSTGPSLALFGIFLVLVSLSLLTFLSGLGILHGKRKGFALAIPMFALFMLQGGGLTVLGLAIAVYCVLRLLAVIGPRPI